LIILSHLPHQELLLTELILDNKFNERSLPEIAAMLSTLTCQFDTKSNGNNNSRRGPQCSNSSHSGGKTGTGNGPSSNCNSNEAIETEQPQQKEEEEPVERVSRELLREVHYRHKSFKQIFGFDLQLEADLIEAANRIDTVQRAFKVVSSPVVDEIKFGLMEVVYQWASGMVGN
jgi:superfamily II RNA helicase